MSLDMRGKKNKDDKQLALILVFLFFIHFINNVAKSILSIPDSIWDLMSYAGFAIGGGLVLLVIPKAIKRHPVTFIVTEVIGVFFFCISLMQNHNHLPMILNLAFWTLGICIPIGFLAYSIIEKQVLYNTMLSGSYYMTALISLVFLFNWFRSPGTYSMTFSYSLLYPLLFHLDAYFSRRKAVYLFLSLYQMTLILLYGSRGAVLCFSVFIIIKIVLGIKTTIRKTAIVGVGGVAVVGFYLNFESIGNFVLGFLSQNGYYSRTLTSFFNGSLLQSSGRDEIQAKALDMILEKPWTGWGVGGEVSMLGTYPHNLFIELLLDFGILLGGLACIFIVANVIQVFYLGDGLSQNLLFIFLCAGFIPLLLSSTYLKQYEFFIFMFLGTGAICNTNVKRISHRQKVYANERRPSIEDVL